MDRRLKAAASALGPLEDELRRRIYLFVRRERRPVTREEVAAAVGISRKLAAFHLDKLLDRGLLKAHYARPPGRTGSGAGRSSKLYEPSDKQIEVSFPARRYEFVGRILVDALRNVSPGERSVDVACRTAREAGVELGEEVRRRRGLRPPGPERTLAVAEDVLSGFGYEPYRDADGHIALLNCPFHDLACRSPELVCALNRAFIDGVLRGLGNDSVEALLEPKPGGHCCVRLRAP